MSPSCTRSTTVAALFLVGAILPALGQSPAVPATHIRVVAANLTSGRQQSYDPGHGSRILQGLKPDICMVQEMNAGDKSDDAVHAWVRAVFGPQFFVYREAGEIPNGIVSRWRIIESGEWDDPEVINRDFAWARLDIPGARDLWVISTHLLTKSEPKRAAEAQVLVRLIQEHVPEHDLLLLGGDLNTRSRREPCIAALSSKFVTDGPFPADEAGNEATNAKRVNAYDWVLADKDLDQYKVPVTIAGRTFPAGLVFDSRVFTQLVSVSPAQPEDSAAENMQHMAVVRDFAVPVNDKAP